MHRETQVQTRQQLNYILEMLEELAEMASSLGERQLSLLVRLAAETRRQIPESVRPS